jgi:hypothetical protein
MLTLQSAGAGEAAVIVTPRLAPPALGLPTHSWYYISVLTFKLATLNTEKSEPKILTWISKAIIDHHNTNYKESQ